MPKPATPAEPNKVPANGASPKNTPAKKVKNPKNDLSPLSMPTNINDFDQVFTLVKNMERLTSRIDETIKRINSRLEGLEKIVESLTQQMEEQKKNPDALKTYLNDMSTQLIAQALISLKTKYPEPEKTGK